MERRITRGETTAITQGAQPIGPRPRPTAAKIESGTEYDRGESKVIYTSLLILWGLFFDRRQEGLWRLVGSSANLLPCSTPL